MSEEEKPTDEEIFEILQTAISDVGRWRRWAAGDDTVQLEFGGVQLLDTDTFDKNSKSAVLSLQFIGNSFLWVYDDGEAEGWHNDLHEDKIEPFPIDYDLFEFCNPRAMAAIENEYKNKTVIKEAKLDGQQVVAFSCGTVAVIAGGDHLFTLDDNVLSAKQIVNRRSLWWEYWEDYWKKKGTEEAYPEDYACEETIPIKTELTPGNEEWGKNYPPVNSDKPKLKAPDPSAQIISGYYYSVTRDYKINFKIERTDMPGGADDDDRESFTISQSIDKSYDAGAGYFQTLEEALDYVNDNSSEVVFDE